MKKVLLILVGLSIFLVVFDRTLGFGFARDAVQIIFIPIEIGLHEVGLKAYDKTIFLTKLPLIYKENKELREEVYNLQALIAENQNLTSENKALREQLGVNNKEIEVRIFAQVLGMDASGEKVFILINKGKENGILVGDIVVLRKFLVGKVVTANQHQSKVLPVFSNESKLPIHILSSGKKINGLAVGEYNAQVKVKEVLQDEDFEVGDLVVTSGSAGTFPPNLLVGKVEKIDQDENKLFQEVKVSMFWDVKELQNVFVLK